MKENMKKRLAVCLSVLVVLSVGISVMSRTAQTIQAAYTHITWTGSLAMMGPRMDITSLTVEKGAEFYIGDYIAIHNGPTYKLASAVKASYTSNKKSVATVNGKGYLVAKSVGTAKITIKYKGISQTGTLKVVEEGSFGEKESYQKLAEAAETVAKNIPSKVTARNGYGYLEKMTAYEDLANSLSQDVSPDGFVKKESKMTLGYNSLSVTTYVPTEKLAVPKASRYNRLRYELNSYANKNSPILEDSSRKATIASARATAQKLTIKLKKAISKEQMLAMKISERDIVFEDPVLQKENIDTGNNKVYVWIYLRNKNKPNDQLYMPVCMTQGSKIIISTGKPRKKKYVGNKVKSVNAKLKKGTSYILEWNNWVKAGTVKVK